MAAKQEQLDKQALLDNALVMLADPIKHGQKELDSAARIVNEGIAAAAAEIVQLESNWARTSLDLVSRGDHSGAQALCREIAEKRECLQHLKQAAKEVNRRLDVALKQADDAKESVQWKAVAELMKQREEKTSRLVALVTELGEVYGSIASLADKIWDELPRKPHSNPQFIDFFDMAGMQTGLDWYLDWATGFQFGQPRLGDHPVPDLVANCRSGHRELLSKKPLDGLGQSLVIDAAEYERRVKNAA